MRTNQHRERKEKEGKKLDHENWEERARTMKTQRRERHKAKNQKAHQWSRLIDDDEISLDY